MMDRWHQLHSMRSVSSDHDLTHQPRLRKHVSRGSIPNLDVPEIVVAATKDDGSTPKKLGGDVDFKVEISDSDRGPPKRQRAPLLRQQTKK